MIGFLSKLFGGNKSDKDIKRITPIVGEISRAFDELQALSNDELRNKTVEFRQRIREYLTDIDAQIADRRTYAEGQPDESRAAAYDEVDKLVKQRDTMI